MAATPTELLAVDAQRLEESNQRIVTRLDALEREFAAFRSRLNTIVAISSTAALFLLSLTTMIWTGVSSLQRELGRTEATIANQDRRFDEMRDALKGIGEKLGRVSEDLARLQGRLDREGPAPAPKAKGNGE